MAILTTFAFSEDANQIPNPNGQGASLNVINPQNVFRPMFIPGSFSFAVTFGIAEMDPELTQKIRFTLAHSEDPDQIIVDTNDINIGANPNIDRTLPKEANGIMLNMDFRNVPFKKQGKYIGKIIFNGELLEEKVVYVFPQESL